MVISEINNMETLKNVQRIISTLQRKNLSWNMVRLMKCFEAYDK
jgi:hypothetical protein